MSARTTMSVAAAAPEQAPPAHSRRRPTLRWVRLAAAPGATLLLTRALGEYGNSIVVAACITVIIAAGLHVLVHWTGQVSLGQVTFVAIGAYVTARANADFGLPLPLAAAAGVGAAVAASAVVGLPALRLQGFALAIATLAVGVAAHQWLYLQPWLLPVSTGVPLRDTTLLGLAVDHSRQLVVAVVLLTFVVVGATVRLGQSGLGRAMRVVAHDEEVAASYGISIAAHKLAAFLFAGGCAGLAGALTVMSIGQAGRSVFPPALSILYVSAVLLGGRGPVWGSLVAAAGLGAAPTLLGGLGRFVALVGPLGILFVVRSFPDGLNGQFRMQATALARLVHSLRPAARTSEVP